MKYWPAVVEACPSLLLVELARGPEYCSSTILYRLTEYFGANPDFATLGGFASFIGYSEHYAAKLVKRHTGRSFLDVMVSLKMERAKRLLAESNAAIAEIAGELGYANPSGLTVTSTGFSGLIRAEGNSRYSVKVSRIRAAPEKGTKKQAPKNGKFSEQTAAIGNG